MACNINKTFYVLCFLFISSLLLIGCGENPVEKEKIEYASIEGTVILKEGVDKLSVHFSEKGGQQELDIVNSTARFSYDNIDPNPTHVMAITVTVEKDLKGLSKQVRVDPYVEPGKVVRVVFTYNKFSYSSDIAWDVDISVSD